MADYAWPSDLVPYQMSFYLQPHTVVHESPFTRQVQTLGRSAPRWVASVQFHGGAGAGLLSNHSEGARLEAWLTKLKGPQKTVTFFDFRRPTGRSALRSHSDYAATVATTYFTDGTDFTDNTGFNVSGIATGHLAIKASVNTVSFYGIWPGTKARNEGDYIGFSGEGRPHIITDAPDADVNGNVTLTFEPPLAAAVADDSYTFTEVRGTFRLTSDDAGDNPTDTDGFGSYSFDLVEVL